MIENPTDNQATVHTQPDKADTAPKPSAVVKAKFLAVFSGVLIVIALLAAGGALYFAYQDRTAAVATRATLENLVEASEMLGARLEDLEVQLEQLRDSQNATSRALLDLAGELPGSNEDWALAEIEFLLVLATHHVQLERNLDDALAAMQAASLRLRGLDNPALDQVRAQLARDIGRLQELNSTDTRGLALMLGDLASRVSSLPLAGSTVLQAGPAQEIKDAEDQSPTWKGIPGAIWRELRDLVVIKHDTGGRQMMLPPGQEYFVYQNLRLELEIARLSLLRRDGENLHAAVTVAQEILADYFAAGDPSVTNAMDSLHKLSPLKLDPDIPDISSSLESLRAYLRSKPEDLSPGEENMEPET